MNLIQNRKKRDSLNLLNSLKALLRLGKTLFTRVVTGIKDFVPTKETTDFCSVFKKMSSWLASRLFINVLNIESVVIPTNSGQSASSLLAKPRCFSFNELKSFSVSPPFANTKNFVPTT